MKKIERVVDFKQCDKCKKLTKDTAMWFRKRYYRGNFEIVMKNLCSECHDEIKEVKSFYLEAKKIFEKIKW
jgi:hypothetical protein